MILYSLCWFSNYDDLENLKKIFSLRDQFIGSWALSFSIYNFVTLMSPFQIFISKLYLLMFILTFTFFLGLIICIFVYFAFYNYYYREIFLFFIIPYLFLKKDDHYLIKLIIYFLLGRYLFFLMSNYLYLNNFLTDYLFYLLLFKTFLDLFLISTLLGILLGICTNLLNSNVKKLKI